jgi:hypothetical protein
VGHRDASGLRADSENVITMYDVVYAMTAKVADKSLKVTATSKVSFTKDIYPLLRRDLKIALR